MCGRFTSLLSPELLSVIYGVQSPSGDRDLSTVRWGLVPHWAKDQSIGSKMINARSETVHEKPAFRQAIRSRRCIVPASGFFEWSATPDGKLPHYIYTRDGSPFSFAGIRESWEAPDGHVLETCAILTTAANDLMAAIHDRMPVILQQTDFDLWLDNTMTDPLNLQRLYQPHPAELMTSWPVSSFVNSPRNDSAACIEPVTA